MAALGPATRVKSATIPPSKGYPTGRFPMNDKAHARLALQMLPRAKGLSSGEAAAIKSRAQGMLGGARKAAASKASQPGYRWRALRGSSR